MCVCYWHYDSDSDPSIYGQKFVHQPSKPFDRNMFQQLTDGTTLKFLLSHVISAIHPCSSGL